MKSSRKATILAGVFLAGVCLVGIVVFSASGLAAWWLTSRSQAPPAVLGPTSLAATPVRPVLITPTRPAGGEPTEAFAGTPDPAGAYPGAGTPAGPAPATATATLEVTATYVALLPGSSCLPVNHPSVTATVLRVIDGVTIEVSAAGETFEVSYIGVALPDYAEDPSIWTRARERNEALVGGRQVTLIQERTDQDVFGRRPRYVLSSGVFVNQEMIRSGYAIAAEGPPDLRCSAFLLEAEQQAVTARLGLWQPEATETRILIPTPTATVAVTGPMVITGVSKRGTIWEEPEEFVEFRNDSLAPIQLEDWTLQDDERHIFTFPTFVLGPGQYCRVYTNEYHPTSCGFSYFSPSPIWDNLTECAYLKDPYGELVSQFCYGFQ